MKHLEFHLAKTFMFHVGVSLLAQKHAYSSCVPYLGHDQKRLGMATGESYTTFAPF